MSFSEKLADFKASFNSFEYEFPSLSLFGKLAQIDTIGKKFQGLLTGTPSNLRLEDVVLIRAYNQRFAKLSEVVAEELTAKASQIQTLVSQISFPT